MKKENCTLCGSNNTFLYKKDKNREYIRCLNCQVIHVPKRFHLTTSEEKKRYDLHTNSDKDTKYINFLSRIVNPVKELIPPKSKGLDFGCGPSPVLKTIFEKDNIEIFEYDLFYNDNKELLKMHWDFIITTEVVEHLSNPFHIIKSLWYNIKPNGILAIMTNLYNEDIDFNSWYYKGDPTHITFFTTDSFLWLAKELNAKVEFFDKDITILKKK